MRDLSLETPPPPPTADSLEVFPEELNIARVAMLGAPLHRERLTAELAVTLGVLILILPRDAHHELAPLHASLLALGLHLQELGARRSPARSGRGVGRWSGSRCGSRS